MKKVTVCWKCKKNNITLFRLRNDLGKKTEDYGCVDHKSELPRIANQSFIHVPELKDLKELEKQKENGK